MRRPIQKGRTLRVVGARGNNLKDVAAEFPLGAFVCVAGVSGGGKSTLVIDTLYKATARRLMGAGAFGFLVGESLMRQDDVESATRALLAVGA